jgi:hypothetical protein
VYIIRKHLFLFYCLLIIGSFLTPRASADASVKSKDLTELKKENIKLEEQIEKLQQRLDRLEPPKPITIPDSPFPFEHGVEQNYPTDVVPISEVIKQDKRIAFKVIKSEQSYKRPIYDEHWHSTYWGGRWSYVPSRIHYALHRLFTYYDIGISGELNFKQHVGIDFPTFQNKTNLDLYVIVFQTKVTDVYTKGNQIVIVGTPTRTGVEVLTVKTRDIEPSNKEKLLLFQLATNSHELDYSLISYQPPDFWLQQIQKAKERNQKRFPSTD